MLAAVARKVLWLTERFFDGLYMNAAISEENNTETITPVIG